jgi:hypothetical protein
MHHGRERGKMNLPAGSVQAVAEIDLLRIHEESLIEAAYRFERLAADRQRCPMYPGNCSGIYGCRVIEVAVSEKRDIATQLA